MNNYTFKHFDNVEIVMVRPTEAGNIGAVARAMKNMALSKLSLINPNNFPSRVATARASSADDILHNAKIYDSLSKALKNSNLVIASSARQRSNKWQQLDVIDSCLQIKEVISSNGKVSVMFGTENSGLSNEELNYANTLMTIPTNPEYSSLNVAQAVQVFAYQNFITNNKIKFAENTTQLAKFQDIENFYIHLEQVLDGINYIDNTKPREFTLSRIYKIFNKANLTNDELRILRGILHNIQPFKK